MKWLAESGQALPNVPDPSRSEPILVQRRSISKFLNAVDCPEEELLEVFGISYELTDTSISKKIREKDSLVEGLMGIAAGISQKLPRTYNVAMKSNKSELWDAACKGEIMMLILMEVWEEVPLPAGKQVVSSKWVFNLKCEINSVVIKHKELFVV